MRETIYRKLKDKAAFFLSKNELRKIMTSDDIDNVLDSINRYEGKGFYRKIRLAQEYGELKSLCRRVTEHKPEVIVEIGTWNGGTFYVWSRINPQARKIISIDLPDGQFGGGYDEKRIKFFREFAYGRKDTEMYFIRGDSKSKQTVDKLEKILGNDRIDFLYIDGDHTYEGIKKDFEIYIKLMSGRGIIGLHDINTLREGYGVHKYWNEIKNNFKHEEFIKQGSRIMGNGIIYLGK